MSMHGRMKWRPGDWDPPALILPKRKMTALSYSWIIWKTLTCYMAIMRERGADLETDAERPGQRDQHQHPGGEDQQTATEARALAPRVLGGGAWS